METQDAPIRRSSVQDASNETANLEANAIAGGPNAQVSAEVPRNTPPEVQNLD